MGHSLNPRIKLLLDAAYSDFHSHYYREKDPVSLVHAFADRKDREVVAFYAALLAYGNVPTILNSVRKILLRLGEEPYRNVIDLRFRGLFSDFVHRFTTGDDIEILGHWLSGVLRSHGSLEAYFCEGGTDDIKVSLSRFVNSLTDQTLPKSLLPVKQRRERNLKYLLSDPMRGSACKRLNMYLRWMVRPEDGIDLGIWSRIDKSKLVLPIDTHLLKTLQHLRWTKSKQANWKVAESATARLRLYSPEDPVRYDFALCHLSMAGKSIADY